MERTVLACLRFKHFKLFYIIYQSKARKHSKALRKGGRERAANRIDQEVLIGSSCEAIEGATSRRLKLAASVLIGHFKIALETQSPYENTEKLRIPFEANLVLTEKCAEDLQKVFQFQGWAKVAFPVRTKVDIVMVPASIEESEEPGEDAEEGADAESGPKMVAAPDIIEFDYKNPRVAVLTLLAEASNSNEKMERCKKGLLNMLFNDTTTKHIRYESPERVLHLVKVIFEMEQTMTAVSWDLCEAPNWVVEYFEDWVAAAKILALALDPVVGGYASATTPITHEDYMKFCDMDNYWPEDNKECPFYFRDWTSAMKGNKAITAGLANYLKCQKTSMDLGPKMAKATQDIGQDSFELSQLEAILNDWKNEWSDSDKMPAGSDAEFKQQLKVLLDKLIRQTNELRDRKEQVGNSIYTSIEKIIEVLDPSGLDATLQKCAELAESAVSANDAIAQKSELQSSLTSFQESPDRFHSELELKLALCENEAFVQEVNSGLRSSLGGARTKAILAFTGLVEDGFDLTLAEGYKRVLHRLGNALIASAPTASKQMEEIQQNAFNEIIELIIAMFQAVDDLQAWSENVLEYSRRAESHKQSLDAFKASKWVSGTTLGAEGKPLTWRRPQIPNGDLLDGCLAKTQEFIEERTSEDNQIKLEIAKALTVEVQQAADLGAEYAGGTNKKGIYWRDASLSSAVTDEDDLEALKAKGAGTILKATSSTLENRKTSLYTVFLQSCVNLNSLKWCSNYTTSDYSN